MEQLLVNKYNLLKKLDMKSTIHNLMLVIQKF